MLIVNSILYVFIIYLMFFVGLFGVFLARKNLILFLLSMEIIFLATNLMFVVGSFYSDDIAGLSFVLFLLAVAANEVAIGLALLIVYTRKQNHSNQFFLNFLKS